MTKAQLRKMKIDKVLQKMQKQKEKEKWDNWKQDQVFEEYLDKILVSGPLFRKWYTANINENREREIDKNEFKILDLGIKQNLTKTIQNTYAMSKMTSLRTSEVSMSVKDHQGIYEKDYKRSTWWSNENQKSYKIQRWLQNQEVLYKLQSLQEQNHLSSNVVIGNIAEGIELLLKTIYELNGNVDNNEASQ